MPSFFLDTHDGDEGSRVEVGTGLPDRHGARVFASLPDMARDALQDRDRRDSTAAAPEGSRRLVFTATLSLPARWVG